MTFSELYCFSDWCIKIEDLGSVTKKTGLNVPWSLLEFEFFDKFNNLLVG